MREQSSAGHYTKHCSVLWVWYWKLHEHVSGGRVQLQCITCSGARHDCLLNYRLTLFLYLQFIVIHCCKFLSVMQTKINNIELK